MIRHVVFASIVLAVVSAPALAAINVVSISRDVQADVTGGVQQQFTSALPGGYGASFNVSNNLDPAGFGNAIANQMSFVPNLLGLSAGGNGHTRAQATPTGVGPLSLTADSSLDMFFTVTANQTYTLNSNVFWFNHLPGAFGGYARVQLWDTTNNIVPHDVQHDNMIPGAATLNQQIPLVTGAVYRLRAESHIFGGSTTQGAYSSDAGWDFALFVPEPSSFVLALFGLIATIGFKRAPRSVR
jgi:hypothetical protein